MTSTCPPHDLHINLHMTSTWPTHITSSHDLHMTSSHDLISWPHYMSSTWPYPLTSSPDLPWSNCPQLPSEVGPWLWARMDYFFVFFNKTAILTFDSGIMSTYHSLSRSIEYILYSLHYIYSVLTLLDQNWKNPQANRRPHRLTTCRLNCMKNNVGDQKGNGANPNSTLTIKSIKRHYTNTTP